MNGDTVGEIILGVATIMVLPIIIMWCLLLGLVILVDWIFNRNKKYEPSDFWAPTSSLNHW